MKKTILAAIIFSLTCYDFTNAQISKACITVGGSGNDLGNMVRQTADSGYVEIGSTISFGLVNTDFYIVKMDKNGNLQWTKTIGGFNTESGLAIEQTTDGGYVFGGFTFSFGAGGDDFYIGRLDANGNFLWGKAIGGGGNEFAFSVQQTSDGGYVLGGQSNSFGSGDYDFCLVKFDTAGNFQWSKTIGASGFDAAYSMQQTSDHGYVMTGETDQFGNQDVYVVKLDSTGNLEWTKTIGGNDVDRGFAVRQTTDNGYVIGGTTRSFGAGDEDFYVIRLDEQGNILWTKTIGGTDPDLATSIQQTTDGGYVVGGYTSSFELADLDVYVVKLDAGGNLEWGSVSGGIGDDIGNSIQQTFDGGYVIGGNATSFGAGFDDFLIDKLDASGNSCCFVDSGGTIGSGGTESSGGILMDATPTITETTPTDTSAEGTFTATCIITAVTEPSRINAFSIYPNPNQGSFEVSLPDDFNNATLFITDVMGKVVCLKEIFNLQKENVIQISLPPTIPGGIYFLELKNGRAERNQEVVICK